MSGDLQYDHLVIRVQGKLVRPFGEAFCSDISEFLKLYKQVPKSMDKHMSTVQNSPFKIPSKKSNDMPNKGIIHFVILCLEVLIL